MTSEAATSLETASSTYDEICRRIYEQIYRKLERVDEERLRFVTTGTAKKILQRNNFLALLFRGLILPGTTAMDQLRLTEEEFLERIEARKLHDFLAILIFGTCGIEAARTFTTKLVAEETWAVLGPNRSVFSSLPASRKDLIALLGDVVAADKFFTTQATFCTVVIHKREEVRIQNPEGYRLPYLYELPLAKGSFGKVFKVKIARGHFYDPRNRMANSEPREMARKDYLISDEFRAQSEREIMEKILAGSAQKCENILESYGSLEIGPTTYSLFMPLAICDLRAYMLEHHRKGPSSTTEKAKLIRSVYGLANGLNFLHNEMKTSDMDDLVCYHMDLKPNNILIFRETNQGEIYNIWKISDFGMARVKIRRRGQDGEKERDFNSWFIRRPQPQDPSLTGTLNRRGEGTYLAPESISSIRRMRAESDVWSLGCVISVVFAYLEEGGEGVTQYQDARMQFANSDSYDRFFVRGTRFTPTKIHPVVKRWHGRLINKARQRDFNEGSAVRFMLDYLEDSVFQINQTKRHSAREVQEKLQRTFKMYNRFGTSDETPGQSGQKTGCIVYTRRPRMQPDADGQVYQWRLGSDEPFKGCVMSPKATLIAYWTDIKIFLYTSQSLSSESNIVSPSAEPYSLLTSSCIWKSICLTEKYLVASTTGANFHCYIFDLERVSSVDASFDHLYRVTLPFPEITKVAISPDSQTLACILRDNEDEPKKSSLFLAPVSELISVTERQPSSSRDWSSSNDSTYNPSNLSTSGRWPLNRLKYPAADITHLSFSTCEDIYIVIRPELTVRSREHTIHIARLNLRTRRLYPLIVESQGLDNANNAGLFTAFSAFRQDPATCAVVTRQKRLHIQKLTEDDETAVINMEIRNYKVIKLMMEWHDQKMFALGMASADNRILLLEMTVPQVEAEDISIRVLAQLSALSYGEEFTERLSDDMGEKYILIASLGRANRHVIYRIPLPG